MLRADYTFQPLSMGLSPWKTVVVSINEGLFGNITVSGLPYGRYNLYLAVTPAGIIDSYYLYETYFEISEGSGGDTYDVEANGVPRFVKTDYIELDKIRKISRFSSAARHAYSDDFETRRSMKHYFNPKGTIDWSSIKIYSPVRGYCS